MNVALFTSMVASLRFMVENCEYKAVFKVSASCPGGPFFVFFSFWSLLTAFKITDVRACFSLWGRSHKLAFLFQQ